MPFLSIATPFPIKRCPNKLAPSVPYNILRNSPFCSFTPFLTDSVTLFKNNPESSRDFTILIRSSKSLFDIISVVFPDPNIFLCIPASAANVAAVSPKGINRLLTNEVIAFFIKDNLVLIKDQVIYLETLLTVSFFITEFLKI